MEDFIDIFGKEDKRPKRGSWAPGGYSGKCSKCGDKFIGDKRARECADCAYSSELKGDCDMCGEWSSELMQGACEACREKHHLP